MDQWSGGTHESHDQGGYRQRYHDQSHEQLKAHLQTFLMAYNFARRLKTLKGLTPYEYVCNLWTTEPERFKINPTQHTVGLNT